MAPPYLAITLDLKRRMDRMDALDLTFVLW
jgi:hypothetical protein